MAKVCGSRLVGPLFFDSLWPTVGIPSLGEPTGGVRHAVLLTGAVAHGLQAASLLPGPALEHKFLEHGVTLLDSGLWLGDISEHGASFGYCR